MVKFAVRFIMFVFNVIYLSSFIISLIINEGIWMIGLGIWLGWIIGISTARDTESAYTLQGRIFGVTKWDLFKVKFGRGNGFALAGGMLGFIIFSVCI